MILKEKQLKSISKFLSFILRHHPEQIGITLDKDGWVDIDTLLTQVNHPERGFTGNPLTYEVLLEVVENNDKKRFTLLKTANASALHKVIRRHKFRLNTKWQRLLRFCITVRLSALFRLFWSKACILPRAILSICLPMRQQPSTSAPDTASRLY